MAMTQEEKQAQKEARQAIRRAHIEALRINGEMNQPHVKQLTITIEWKKSRTWGSNPHAQVEVEYYEDKSAYSGRFERRNGYTCSGCGYDKESTVIADIFNEFLKYKLYDKTLNEDGAPYGIYLPGEYEARYNGGIGTNCYYAISGYIGGKFEHVASGKTFDVYRYTDNENEKEV